MQFTNGSLWTLNLIDSQGQFKALAGGETVSIDPAVARIVFAVEARGFIDLQVQLEAIEEVDGVLGGGEGPAAPAASAQQLTNDSLWPSEQLGAKQTLALHPSVQRIVFTVGDDGLLGFEPRADRVADIATDIGGDGGLRDASEGGPTG
jgi:hypothetical protein